MIKLFPFFSAVPRQSIQEILIAHDIRHVWKLRLGKSQGRQRTGERMDVNLVDIRPEWEVV
jgi:hypothetical protein